MNDVLGFILLVLAVINVVALLGCAAWINELPKDIRDFNILNLLFALIILPAFCIVWCFKGVNFKVKPFKRANFKVGEIVFYEGIQMVVKKNEKECEGDNIVIDSINFPSTWGKLVPAKNVRKQSKLDKALK